MTVVKRLDKVRKTTFLTSVSRNDLIYTVHDCQRCLLGHVLQNTHSPHASTYALCQPTHGRTRLGHPRTNYTDLNENQQTHGYVTRSTGLAWTCGHIVLTYYHLTIERGGEKSLQNQISFVAYIDIVANLVRVTGHYSPNSEGLLVRRFSPKGDRS